MHRKHRFPKKTFIGNRLEYLKFLPGNKLLTSIIGENDTSTYYVLNDTLFIAEEYITNRNRIREEVTEWHKFLISKSNEDTLELYKSEMDTRNKRDTIKFINRQRLEKPITNFTRIILSFNNALEGTVETITVDSLRHVFIDIQTSTFFKKEFTTVKGQLTKIGYKIFLDKLKHFLPHKLPGYTYRQVLDGYYFRLELQFNGTKKISSGNSLSWIHAELIDFLLDIQKQEGFIKNK